MSATHLIKAEEHFKEKDHMEDNPSRIWNSSRSDDVRRCYLFLTSKNLPTLSFQDRVSFLRSKGMSEGTIEEALGIARAERAAGESRSSRRANRDAGGGAVAFLRPILVAAAAAFGVSYYNGLFRDGGGDSDNRDDDDGNGDGNDKDYEDDARRRRTEVPVGIIRRGETGGDEGDDHHQQQQQQVDGQGEAESQQGSSICESAAQHTTLPPISDVETILSCESFNRSKLRLMKMYLLNITRYPRSKSYRNISTSSEIFVSSLKDGDLGSRALEAIGFKNVNNDGSVYAWGENDDLKTKRLLDAIKIIDDVMENLAS